MTVSLNSDDALLLVDIQNDFLDGGSLAVPDGNAVIEPVNHYISMFTEAGCAVFASCDAHPVDHCSFVENGGRWPTHCVRGTFGAAFATALALPEDAIIISKAMRKDKDAYSAMQGTDFRKILEEKGVRRLFVCGLATDYCVAASSKDLLDAGFTVVLLVDAIRGVNVHSDDSDQACRKLRDAGALEITLAELSL